MMNSKLSSLLILLTFLCWVSAATAAGQLYFIGKHGPIGASSVTGQNSQGVYLRWDVLEGELPSDLERFRLTRSSVGNDEQIIGEWPATGIMSESEIYQMFNQPSQQQRLLEIVTTLKEVSLSELANEQLNRDNASDFEVNQYAPHLIQRLQGDVFWSLLAARQNFNIARIMRRAYLDSNVQTNAIYDYTLYAINDTQSSILGKTQVNTGQSYALLPVRQLRQLPFASQCDSTQDHYTVALDWLAPGSNVTDQAANNIQLAGYEVYRSLTDLGQDIPDRDLAAEAASLSHNARGKLQFSGLERVSPQLIMLDGTTSENDEGSANAEYIEAKQQLISAGLNPGDRRAYYVVGRDFAGHYGPTEKVNVTIPYMLPPEAPWQLESRYLSEQERGIALNWDRVNLDNFQLNNPGYTLCSDQITNGVISYTANGSDNELTNAEACDTPLTALINVDSYQVYRFETFVEARDFKDSDGDGVSDQEEYSEGTQCNALSQPSGSRSYRVDNNTFRAIDAARERIEFRDQSNELEVGKSYWYRIASKTSDGRFSLPTPPIRVLLPDLSGPASPSVSVERYTTGNCCTLEAIDVSAQLWELQDNVGGKQFSIEEAGQESPAISPTQFGNWASSLCRDEQSQINSYWGTRPQGSPSRILNYGEVSDTSDPDKKNTLDQLYCKADIPNELDLCKSGTWAFQSSSCDVLERVNPGEVTEGPLRVTINAGDENSCVEYYETINGQEALLESSCGTDTPGQLVFEVEGGLLCGSVIARDDSNNASAPVSLPCNVIANDNVPSPPQLLTLDAYDDRLDFSWRTPIQPTSVTLVEIRSDVDTSSVTESDYQLLTFPNEGLESGRVFDESSTIHTLLNNRDQWCIRALAVGPQISGQTPRFSEWSSSLCKTRRANIAQEVSYIPWPKIPALEQGRPLSLRLAKDYVDDRQGQAVDRLPILVYLGAKANLFSGADPLCHYLTEQGETEPDFSNLFFTDFYCSPAGKSVIEFDVPTPFLLYRQGRTPDGERGPWVQVSALEPKIDWALYGLGKLEKETGGFAYQLSDEHFVMYREDSSQAATESQWHLAYRDYYPYINGYDYRYQLVMFNQRHAISSWRMSDWITAGLDSSETNLGGL